MGLLGRLAARIDSWVNPFSGFGTDRDKTTGGEFLPDRALDDNQLSALYHFDAIAARIANIVPDSAFRQGLPVVTCADNPDVATRVAKGFERLAALKHFRDASIWGRVFGGAVVFVGANDGRAADTPLDVNAVRSVDFLQVYDRRRAWPMSWYTDPRHMQYDKPETYMLQGLKGGTATVHETRLLRFGGVHTADYDRQKLLSWDYSVFQATYEYLRSFHDANKAAEHLLGDASQGVFKLKGLISAIAEGNMRDLIARVQLLDMSRGVARSVMIDADSGEEFVKVATSFAGVSDMLDRSANLLSAASGIPVTLLMGQAPAGLNATGESDVRTFYDTIKAYQTHDIGPHVRKLAELLAVAAGFPGAKLAEQWPPLWQETAKESAERRKLVADTDAIYITNEVLTPEEVALNRFRPEGWNPETSINAGLRAAPTLPAASDDAEPPPNGAIPGPSAKVLGTNPLGTP